MHGERASAGLVMHIAESPIQRYCDIIIIVGDSAVAPLSLVSLAVHPSIQACQSGSHSFAGKIASHYNGLVVWCIGGKVRAAAAAL